jgi:hypothetical protein
MVNKSIAALLALAFAAAGASAATVNFDQNGSGVKDITNTTTGIEIPKVTVPATKDASSLPEWTLMVFENGKNNLEPYAIKNFKQMENVGSSDKLNIVVEMGRYKNDNTNGAWTGCRRYLVQKSNSADMTSPVLQTIPQCDMGDYNHAIDFGKWAMSNYPAKHYMFILWNHGAGWVKSASKNLPPNPATDMAKPVLRGISYDDETNNHIDTPQMAKILQALGHVDVYGSDACLMQMAEVDTEIKPYVDYIVGSEETEPGDGYTYDDFLNRALQSDLTPSAFAKAAVDSYGDHYVSINDTTATQSYLASSSVDKFNTLVTNFAQAVMDNNDKSAATTARSNAQKYAYDNNKDLYDFVSQTVSNSSNQAVQTAGNNLMQYISGTLILDNRSSANSHGIAIYVPNSSYDSNYNELAFAKATNWPTFVQWLLNGSSSGGNSNY